MEFADPGRMPISPLPAAQSRSGEAEGIGSKASAASSVESRFRHVNFRGITTMGVGGKKGGSIKIPPPPPLPQRSQAVEDADTSFIRQTLVQAGLNPALYRPAPLVRRLPACLRALRVDSSAAAGRLLAARPALVPMALESLLIGTTELFRDPAIFTQLEHDVLPQLIRRPTPPRIWSAACSDGAEIYSVAMLMAKLGGLEGSHLLASDCRHEAIRRGKRGIYLPGERTLPVTAGRYWHAQPDGRIAMSDEMRQAVKWEHSDLFASRTNGSWDLILCRNLAIYLEPAAADMLWLRLADALAPGGFLIVGKAEKPRLAYLNRVAPSIYCKCTPLQTSS